MTLRRRKAFSMVEAVTVIAITIILGALVFAGLDAARNRAADTTAKDVVALIVSTQEGAWRTYGTFADTNKMEELESSYTYVSGNESSTGPTIVSVHIPEAALGEEVVGIAVRGDSGECYTAIKYQPRAPRSLENTTTSFDSSSCTGAAAFTGGN